jgi:hypothetical protein
LNQRLIHSLLLSSALLATLAPAVRADETKLQVQKATGKIELTDPAGDVQPIHSSSRDYPGLDVVGLAIASDGKQIAFTLRSRILPAASRPKSSRSTSIPTTSRRPECR